MKTSAERLAALGCAGLVAVTVAGCGSVTDAVKGDSGGKAITMGTRGLTSVLDPAGAYDTGSWLVLSNTFQSLLAFPPAASSPTPDAAQSCEFVSGDTTQYHCVLRPDQKFANGHALTAADVVFSIQRTKKIKDPNGPSGLLDTIKSVEAKGDNEVVFHLSAPDATLPAKLATPAGAIVDHEVYPADKLLDNDKVVGSGPYKLDSVETMTPEGGSAKVLAKVVLTPNGKYAGDAKLQNDKFTVRYFDNPAALKDELDKGGVDLTDNSLEPNTAARILDDQQNGKGDLTVVHGDSSDTNSIAFNTKDATTGNLAVRQAVAQLVDRKALARDVFARTVQPLYSMVPTGITGHNTVFSDKYGDPDVAKAKAILAAAKVPVPVKLNLASGRSRTGTNEIDTLKRQLEAGGLFQVTTQVENDSAAYQKGRSEGKYQAYLVGWTADYPDPDNYIGPLVAEDSVYRTGWVDERVTQKLLPEGLKQADRGAVSGIYNQVQGIVAENVPLIPMFQTKAFFAAKPYVTGVESTVDTTGVFRFWEIGRNKK